MVRNNSLRRLALLSIILVVGALSLIFRHRPAAQPSTVPPSVAVKPAAAPVATKTLPAPVTAKAATTSAPAQPAAKPVVVQHASPPSTFPVTDRQFTTSPTLSTEARTLVQLLEQAHYNREAVHSSNYAEVIPNYMGDLDGQRLFFITGDKAAFATQFGKNVYWNLSALGNIDAAYDIFAVYQSRASARLTWVFEELKNDTDLTVDDSYLVDRTKAEWPATMQGADALWRQRIKYELIAELMNKKTVVEAKATVRKRYERMLKNLGEIDGSDLAELFLSNVARLYDPHSTYFSAASFEDFGIQMKLQLVGIGAVLGVEDDYCVVKEIVPGGPADLGKQLKPNDKIISVAQPHAESVEIIGMKLRKIVAQIRGNKGSPVTLTIQPASATDPSTRKTITIVRDVVKINSSRAHAALFSVPGTDGQTVPLGVITLPAFYGPADGNEPDADKTSASKDVERLIGQLKTAGIKGLVLDLRHNGGGFLSEAIDLTGLFVRQGPVVQVKNSSGEIQVDSDTNTGVAYNGPLAVLVDRFSASASEIVTGALQNYGRAIVIGDSSTHGKGSVQTVLEMKNLVPQLARSPIKAGATKLTVQKYYLPNGSSTQLKGVVPDIVLPSIDEFLPIGEASLPHALVWDEIPTSSFDGRPLDPKIASALRAASVARQAKLAEFLFLRKNVDWFKMRQSQKLISLNLETRRAQKVTDDTFRKAFEAEKAQLAKHDYPYREFRLGPPLPPRIKPVKKPDASKEDGEDDESELSTDENDAYAKVDVALRESLRVVNDAVDLSQDRQYWASNHAPLTAPLEPKG
ncbi:MAG: carboxyl-terminal processing protease [Verrucomicrobia bacterium]|nr:MAG: carboxyl-terminal processing protease [Verrucomicrobiota bacterium]